ncbi:MAG: SHOCT domain-containing protein [Bacteroidota bacterium]
MHGYYGLAWIWILGAVILIAVIWFLSKQGKTDNGNALAKSNDSPLDILKERYAKGEIDKQEFEERKKDLQ